MRLRRDGPSEIAMNGCTLAVMNPSHSSKGNCLMQRGSKRSGRRRMQKQARLSPAWRYSKRSSGKRPRIQEARNEI